MNGASRTVRPLEKQKSSERRGIADGTTAKQTAKIGVTNGQESLDSTNRTSEWQTSRDSEIDGDSRV